MHICHYAKHKHICYKENTRLIFVDETHKSYDAQHKLFTSHVFLSKSILGTSSIGGQHFKSHVYICIIEPEVYIIIQLNIHILYITVIEMHFSERIGTKCFASSSVSLS